MFLQEKMMGIRFDRHKKVLAFHYIAKDQKGTEYLDRFEIKDGECNKKEFAVFAKNCLVGSEPADFSAQETAVFCKEIYEFARQKIAVQFKDCDDDIISYAPDDSSAALLSCEAAFA